MLLIQTERRPSTIAVVTPAHITADYADDLRAYVAEIFIRSRAQAARPISVYTFWTWLVGVHRDTCAIRIVDRQGREVRLDYAPMETGSIAFWVRDHLLPGARLRRRTRRLKRETKERYALIATILKTANPVAATMWGVRAANNHDAPTLPVALGEFFLKPGRLEAPEPLGDRLGRIYGR